MPPNNYCTMEEVANHLLEDGLIDAGDYERIVEDLIGRASRLIDAWFGKFEGYWMAETTPIVRLYDGNGAIEFFPDHMAVAPTVVEVAESGDLTDFTVWAATDYILYPLNASAEVRPFRSLLIDRLFGTKFQWYRYPSSVRITAQWGWGVATPLPIAEACIVQVARWFKRGQQAFQDAGAVTDLTQLRYLKKIDPEVALILNKMPGGITI